MVLDYYRLVEKCIQAAPCILEIYRIEYFKNVFLNIYTYNTNLVTNSDRLLILKILSYDNNYYHLKYHGLCKHHDIN